MKRLTVVPVLSLFVFSFTFGQEQEKYAELIKSVWSLYESKDYIESAEKYSEAFVALGGVGMINDRYNAACSWALANRPDSACSIILNSASRLIAQRIRCV